MGNDIKCAVNGANISYAAASRSVTQSTGQARGFKFTPEMAQAIGLTGKTDYSDEDIKKINELFSTHGMAYIDSARMFFANSKLETDGWTIEFEDHGKGPGYGPLQLTGVESKSDFYDWAIDNGYVSKKPTDLLDEAAKARAKYDAYSGNDERRKKDLYNAAVAAENKVNKQIKNDDLYWHAGVYTWAYDKKTKRNVEVGGKRLDGTINTYIEAYTQGKPTDIPSDYNLMIMSGFWVKGVQDTLTKKTIPAEYFEYLRDTNGSCIVHTSGEYYGTEATERHNVVVISPAAAGAKGAPYPVSCGRMSRRTQYYHEMKSQMK